MSHHGIGMRCWPVRGFLAVLVVLTWGGVARAQSDPTVVRVEEDWELVIGEPAPVSNAPQIVTSISPLGHVESFYATLTLNYQPMPDFTAGGLQFELWDGEVPMVERRFPDQSVLQHVGEVIRWTQVMSLDGNVLTFEVINGTSTTWGNFGGQGYLKDTALTTLGDLNAYSPNVSVTNSGVSYAANRVQSLVLKRVRYFTSTGEMIEDDTARVVHSQE